ncbi:MAG: hypothetical protein MUC63_06245 [Planctomycetes bacterium]|jgi:hypothetical protein|nr:hypothetical protein [Planctomycetota bacterium]
MIERRWIALGSTLAVSAALVFLVLAGRYRDRERAWRDERGRFEVRTVLDDDEAEGRPHVLSVDVRPLGDAPAGSVRALVREPGGGPWETVELRRLETGWTWVGAIPARARGERRALYYAVEPPRGPSERPDPSVFPPGAPDRAALPQVAWKGRAPAAVMALHAGLTAAAGALLLAALHFVLLFWTGRFRERGGDRAALRAAWVLLAAAAACFLVATVPLGIVAAQAVHGTGLGGSTFGRDAAGAKAGILLLLWAPLLAWRADLARPRGDPRPRADRVFAAVFLVAAAASLAAALAAHSTFLTG